jgi:hypothetical protein
MEKLSSHNGFIKPTIRAEPCRYSGYMKHTLTCAVISCLLALTPALHAQTILLVSQELLDGKPLSPPLAVRDGLSAGLYEEGFIVFDDNGSSPATDTSTLMGLARSTGAELVLQVSTEYAESTAGAAVATVTARTTFTLTRVEKTAVIAKGSAEATNKGRESGMDRAGLGVEIGRSIIAQIRKALGDSPS